MFSCPIYWACPVPRQTRKPSRYITNHPGQFGLLSFQRMFIPRLHYQANIEQTSSWLVQLTRASSSSQLHRVNGVLVYRSACMTGVTVRRVHLC